MAKIITQTPYETFDIDKSAKQWILEEASNFSGVRDMDAVHELASVRNNVITVEGDIGSQESVGFAAFRLEGFSTDISFDVGSDILADTGVLLIGDEGRIDNAGEIDAVASGIEVRGNDARIVNTGRIEGGRFAIRADDGVDGLLVTNKQRIEGEQGIFSESAARVVNVTGAEIVVNKSAVVLLGETGETAELVNRGYIDGETDRVVLFGKGNDHFVNSGTVNGDVRLGDGDDFADLRGGTLNTILGGAGDDVFVVSSSTAIHEREGEGIDLVKSTVSHTLRDNVDNLRLIGKAETDGMGNAIANALVGNSAANTLFGYGGNDILTGRGGADTFVFMTGEGKDRITDFENGVDHVDLSGWAEIGGIADLRQNHLSVVGDDLLIRAGTDSIRIEDMAKADLDKTDFVF